MSDYVVVQRPGEATHPIAWHRKLGWVLISDGTYRVERRESSGERSRWTSGESRYDVCLPAGTPIEVDNTEDEIRVILEHKRKGAYAEACRLREEFLKS